MLSLFTKVSRFFIKDKSPVFENSEEFDITTNKSILHIPTRRNEIIHWLKSSNFPFEQMDEVLTKD